MKVDEIVCTATAAFGHILILIDVLKLLPHGITSLEFIPSPFQLKFGAFRVISQSPLSFFRSEDRLGSVRPYYFGYSVDKSTRNSQVWIICDNLYWAARFGPSKASIVATYKFNLLKVNFGEWNCCIQINLRRFQVRALNPLKITERSLVRYSQYIQSNLVDRKKWWGVRKWLSERCHVFKLGRLAKEGKKSHGCRFNCRLRPGQRRSRLPLHPSN